MTVQSFYDELALRYHLIYTEAGFQRVQRIDGRLFQPVLVGFKRAAS